MCTGKVLDSHVLYCNHVKGHSKFQSQAQPLHFCNMYLWKTHGYNHNNLYGRLSVITQQIWRAEDCNTVIDPKIQCSRSADKAYNLPPVFNRLQLLID